MTGHNSNGPPNASKASHLPHAIPTAHLSTARSLDRIATTGKLVPTHCKVFNTELLYLYYGGVFYRTSKLPTRDALELPVAFLFSPSILSRASRYFPFDTGAMALKKFGEWSDQFMPLTGFEIPSSGDWSDAAKLVSQLYETNAGYLHGQPISADIDMTENESLVRRFLQEDCTKFGADHRQHVIECHFTQPIELDYKLLWVGLPEDCGDLFGKICNSMTPDVPEYDLYEYHCNFIPSEVAAQLEMKARDIVERYLDPPGTARQSTRSGEGVNL